MMKSLWKNCPKIKLETFQRLMDIIYGILVAFIAMIVSAVIFDYTYVSTSTLAVYVVLNVIILCLVMHEKECQYPEEGCP